MMASASPELVDWADEALDLGFGSFGDGDHAPFVLFVEVSGERHLIDLKRAKGVINQDLVDAGREVVRQFAGGQFYALVWDGFLTTAGKRQDAVFAEAGAGGGQAFIFAQRYKVSRSGKLSRVGEQLVAAEADHLWAKPAARVVRVNVQ